MPRRRRPPRSGAIAELPPLRILGQIAGLQLIYYTAALILMLFTTLVAGSHFSLDLVFGWSSLRGDTTQGWLMGFVWMCCAGAVIMALVAFISRSKLVPDFALTLHFIHLVIVTLFTGRIPRHAMWWITMTCSSAATVTLGIYGCWWRELRPISFGGTGRSEQNGATAQNGHAAGGEDAGIEGDEEMGLGRGRERGRGRDGMGGIEMAPLMERDHAR